MQAVVFVQESNEKTVLEGLLPKTGLFHRILYIQNIEQYLAYAKNHQIDVVFLDIDISPINRMELAENMKSYNEDIHIIFFSRYYQYAVHAFEINALDYILKPITLERLLKSIKRIPVHHHHHSHDGIRISCFGNLHFFQWNKQALNIKWRTAKAKELFCLLLQYRFRKLSKEMLIDMLWPNANMNGATTLLYTTITQVRKTMKSIRADIKLSRDQNGYYLKANEQEVEIYIETWEQLLLQFPTINQNNAGVVRDILKKYRPYLEDEGYSWTEPERIRLHNIWLTYLYRLIEYSIEKKELEQAMQLCFDIQTMDPDEEKSYQYLLTIYNKLGDVKGAIRQYAKLKEIKNQLVN
ncbi:response regulator [Siminovitchia sp. FSL H7-0308]|uniref:response regulator n=1 Tax=Siminovitchia sp. FSL H7-0308 TaxID=2921432 RepID=UPI0030EF036D